MGSQSFGSGERYYGSVCPVTHETMMAGGQGVVCPRCRMVWYRDIASAQEHAPAHAPLCGLMAKLSLATKARI